MGQLGTFLFGQNPSKNLNCLFVSIKTRKFDTFINNYTDEIESIFDKDILNLGFLEGTTGIILTLNECFSNKGKTQWMKSLMLFDDF